MFSPLHNEMTSALTDLRARQAQIAETVGRLDDVTGNAATKDRTIEAIVDGQGRLTELTFRGQRWRELAPKELGTKIVEVVAEAQRNAADTTAQLVADLVPEGVDLDRLREMGPDLDAMFASAIEEAERTRP